MAETEVCASLMKALIDAVERYNALGGELFKTEGVSPLKALRQFHGRREVVLKEIEKALADLQTHETFLEKTENRELQALKRRVSDLRAEVWNRDEALLHRLKAQRDRVARKLQTLTRAGHAMRRYGRPTHLPPRFLDSLN